MHYTITRSSVQQHAARLLRTCLRLHDFSPTCTASVLLHVLFTACSRLGSLSAACWSLAAAPSRETIRQATLKTLRGKDDLLRRLNRALTVEVPRVLRRRPQQVAIDLVLIPYHGQPMLDLKEVYRSQAKSGTSHFHAYATAYVNYRGQRFTLALTTVERGEKLQEVLKRLFGQLANLGISRRMALLDRGFWSVGVLAYLQRARKPLLMPVVLRGQKADHAHGPSGTGVFATRKRCGWDSCTVTAADGQVARVSIGIHCRNYDGQGGRHGRQTLVYAYWGFEPSSTKWLRQTYRKRFAIETSYWQMHQGRARTCTRSPEVRLLLVGVALVLRNVWVWLHYAILSTPRQGNCRYNLERLTLRTMLLWLQHQAEDELGRRDEVLSERPMSQHIGA
ncbi:MAG: peptide synthetase [Acidobacteria bacterium]|nr:peptide synthetase [Acidobacteriota bacterium]